MTRSRLAAVAALSTASLLVTATGGEAQKEDTYRVQTTCKTRHTDGGGARAAQGTDRVIGRSEAMMQDRPGGRRGGAARLVPAENVKVITKLKDLTTADGNNVLDAKDTDRTNDNGVAKTSHEFNNFGNYRLKTTVKVDGEVVATDTVPFGVADRESGKCDPPLTQ